MSSLGALPPIGQTSLPANVSQEEWEREFKASLKGKTISFPDASTSALHALKRELDMSQQEGQGEDSGSKKSSPPADATAN
mmetsp:Transcript_30027/g.81398  ORF Transcript_30027/g.81398 Transcript_30027/m.81398 type:complete len:81 (-) Transcript_30027:180-422(-)|eukprot:CAMPEP_0171245072 /NCGR_PEP_ID=MMETSP0790-20130122/47224_1 /TAXON_ID=2925 /ORGANISM="Alexandrium catenella, Strain OF101" /LENGTH=80 /DNA_ID=CAMNT_0011712305 /DNA_START=76 /DNA_END=318 /DNA_ORIENTATION=+